MEKKKHKVVLTPADQHERFSIGIQANGVIKFCPLCMQSLGIGNPKHLHILSDDKIENGDWVYNSNGSPNKTFQCEDAEWWEKVHSLEKWKDVGKKIIASTDPKMNTPRLSVLFLKLYCQAQGMDEVWVEMNHPHDGFKLDIKNKSFTLTPVVDKNNNINIIFGEEKKYDIDDMKKAWRAGREYTEKSGDSITFEELIENLLVNPK